MLMAFTNTIATIPGITVPIFVGSLTHSDVSLIISLKCNLTIVQFSAINRLVENHFLRNNCSLHYRDCCIHDIGVRRIATVE